jgi:hypothetical protein
MVNDIFNSIHIVEASTWNKRTKIEICDISTHLLSSLAHLSTNRAAAEHQFSTRYGIALKALLMLTLPLPLHECCVSSGL